MLSNRVPKRMLEGRLEGRRGVGKPRLKWEDSVGRDSEALLRVKNWRRAAEN